MNVSERVQSKTRNRPRRRCPHDLYTWVRLHPFRCASRGCVPSVPRVPICAVRCVRFLYTAVAAVHKQSARNIPEGCVNGTRPCTETKQSTIRRGGARHPPCSLPLRWIVHLSGAVWIQPGEWAAASTAWRLTIRPGEGGRGNTRDCARQNRHRQHVETG